MLFRSVSGGIIILLSIAIRLKKKADEAALAIAGLTLLLSLSRHIPNMLNSWLNALKAFAMFGGTLIIAASFNPKYLKAFLWTGCITLGIFFIVCGYAHIKFYDFVTGFIPAYIPFHGFFAYFTAMCLFAGGVGILIPVTRKWAALLSGLMVAGWFFLLHIPRFFMNPDDMSDRLGLAESLAFAGIFFVLASLTDSKSKQDAV